MDAALADVEFLARSENRVRTLQLLAEGAHTRGELGETIGASQATLGRILEDFRERSWVRRTADAYVATATGRLVAEAVTELLATVETEHQLRGVIEYLPTEAMTFDLDRLADATITTPSPTKPTAPLSRVLDLMGSTADLRAVSHTFNEQSLAVVTDRVEAGEQTFRGVFGAGTIDALAVDERSWEQLTDLAAAENARIWVHDGEVPMAATVGDETVTLLLRDDSRLIQAAVESTDPTVRAWAIDAVEEYRRKATAFSPDAYRD